MQLTSPGCTAQPSMMACLARSTNQSTAAPWISRNCGRCKQADGDMPIGAAWRAERGERNLHGWPCKAQPYSALARRGRNHSRPPRLTFNASSPRCAFPDSRSSPAAWSGLQQVLAAQIPVAQGYLIGSANDAHFEVIGYLAQPDLVCFHPAQQLQYVRVASRGVVLLHGILAVPAAEHIRIAPGAADERVSARAAGQPSNQFDREWLNYL